MEFACCLVLQCSPSCVLCPVLPDCSFQAKCNKYFCPELHRGSIDPSSITCNLCVVYLTSMECSGFGAHKSMLVNHVIQGGSTALLVQALVYPRAGMLDQPQLGTSPGLAGAICFFAICECPSPALGFGLAWLCRELTQLAAKNTINKEFIGSGFSWISSLAV